MASRIAPANAPRVLAIVQAGGKGSRMGVLTADRAKPALPVGGTHQLIDVALSNLTNSGVQDVWVSVQYLAGTLDKHVQHGRPWDLDRNVGGFRRIVPEQSDADLQGGFSTGNADNLYRIRHEIEAEDADVIIVLSADQLFTLDLRDVVAAHADSGADATLVTADISKTEAKNKAVVTTDADGQVTKIEEKPESPDHGTVSAEIMVFSKESLLKALEATASEREPQAEEGDTGLGDVAEHLLPHMVKNMHVRTHPLTTYWRDMGRPEAYLRAHRELLRGDAKIFNDTEWPMRTLGGDRGGAFVREGATVENSFLAAGCDVAGTVRNSTLGQGVTVRAGAVVEDSVIFDDCVIEKDATVRTALVDTAVAIRAGATVGATPKASAARDEDIAIVGHHAVIRSEVKPGDEVEAHARR